MSYKLYIEGLEMELKDINRLAQTKQRNNITNLHTRQANTSNNFALPKTPKNVKSMEFLNVVGNNSTRPYSKLKASLLDTITGDWLIYNGWAVVSSTENDFKVTILDGIIDFYKAIDNKNLSDVNLSGLSHVKNLTNVMDSFSNTLPYIYILADFNGSNYDVGTFNIDYQVPSARMSYIWDRIHDFAGFTYSGAIFGTQKFLNWFMTFPKPVPTTETSFVTVETHSSAIDLVTSGNNIDGPTYVANLFPTNIENAYVKTLNSNYYFKQKGTYKISVSGSFLQTQTFGGNTSSSYFTEITYYLSNSANAILSYGVIDSSGVGYIVLDLEIGDRLSLTSRAKASQSNFGGGGTLTGSQTLTVDLLDGYVVNFDDVLIDFLASDFIKEVLNHFALTPFKDKYSNNIEYKTLKEIIQDPNVVDWSDKYPVKISEKYIVGSYTQKNDFRYKYDKELLNYNDGSIAINNKNLKENSVVVQSKFFTPSSNTASLNGKQVNIYKLWEKEINDDNLVEYKELSNRFYVLRKEDFNQTLNLKSVATSETDTYTGLVPYASNWRLDFRSVIVDNYTEITKILNNSKLLEAKLYLTSNDVAEFDFKRLIYIEQFGSYYIVNRIINFIKNTYTKVELIKVDYYQEPDAVVIVPFTFITITNVEIVGCTITIDFDTDAILPTPIAVEISQINVGVLALRDVYNVSPSSNTITIIYDNVVIQSMFATTNIKLYLGIAEIGLASNVQDISLSGCVIPAESTYINLVSLETIAIVPAMFLSNRRIRVTFTSDLPLPNSIRFNYNGGPLVGIFYKDIEITSNVFEVDIQHDQFTLDIFGIGGIISWNCSLSDQNIISNSIISAS